MIKILSIKERISYRDILFNAFKSYHIKRANRNQIKSLLNKNKDILKLYNNYINEFRTEIEALYCIFHNDDISNHMCPFCGKPNKFYLKMKRYRDTCGSNKCFTAKTTSEESKKKRKNTMKTLYNHEHALQVPEFQKKAEETCKLHHGKNNPGKVKSLKDKSNETRVHNLLGDNPVISNDVIKVIDQLKDYYNNDKKLDLALIYSNDELFSKFIKLLFTNKNRKLSVKEIASIFHLNTGTIRNKCNKLEIYTKYFIVQSIKLELKIIDFLNKNHINYKTHYRIKYKDNNDKIRYTEIDIFIKDFNIGIELNDLDSHNILRKTSNYHYNKIYISNLNNIRLIHLWEWELNDSNWFKTSRWLLHLLNQSKVQLDIKDCIIKGGNYKENLKFLNEYSITSYQDPKQYCGIYYNDELIQLLFLNDNVLSICIKFGYELVKGTEELIYKYLDNSKYNYFIVHCNLDKFTGKTFKDMGFKLINYIEPFIISESSEESSNYRKCFNCGYNIYKLSI